MPTMLTGNEAIARAVIDSGVRVAASYPGSPTVQMLESIARFSDEVHAEWSPSEKVAIEVGIGIGGSIDVGVWEIEAKVKLWSIKFSDSLSLINGCGPGDRPRIERVRSFEASQLVSVAASFGLGFEVEQGGKYQLDVKQTIQGFSYRAEYELKHVEFKSKKIVVGPVTIERPFEISRTIRKGQIISAFLL